MRVPFLLLFELASTFVFAEAAEPVDLAKSDSFLGFFERLFKADFMPHGHCFFWRSDIVWLHVVSDLLIVLAYYSIPLMLLYFIQKKKGVPFKFVFALFSAFIFWCGTTHLLNVIVLWNPVYRLDGVIKAITAGVSVVTAAMLFPLIPKALALRSPKELEKANQGARRRNRAAQVCRTTVPKPECQSGASRIRAHLGTSSRGEGAGGLLLFRFA